jgi:hypothetical protein
MTDQVTLVVLGDFNGDGVINIDDIEDLLAFIVGSVIFTDAQRLAGMFTNDGHINIDVVEMLLAHIVGAADIFFDYRISGVTND